MVKRFLMMSLLYVQIGVAQTIQPFDGKWAFTGLRTTVFKVVDKKLYGAMLEYSDTSNFNRFVQQLPLDSTVYQEASVTQSADTTIMIWDLILSSNVLPSNLYGIIRPASRSILKPNFPMIKDL